MLRSIEGVFREGRIELLEEPPADAEGKVIVTFLSTVSGNSPAADVTTPMRREGGLLVYDGRFIGDVEATLEAVREQRIRQFFPESSP
ncbi:MAG: hypothetical protein HUU20_03110 [Pirellulales bacterium]|nr:hypothetical protein [Pirellulales bacterium]